MIRLKAFMVMLALMLVACGGDEATAIAQGSAKSVVEAFSQVEVLACISVHSTQGR